MNINYPAVYRTEGLINAMIPVVRESFKWPINIYNYSFIHFGSGEEPMPLVSRVSLSANFDIFGIVENCESFDDLPIAAIFNVVKAFFTMNQCKTIKTLRPDLAVQRMVNEYLDHNKVWICILYNIDMKNMEEYIDCSKEIVETQSGGMYEEFIWANAFEHCRFVLSQILDIPIEEIQDGFVCYINYKWYPRRRRLKLTRDNAGHVKYTLKTLYKFYYCQRDFSDKKLTISALEFRREAPIL